jgi:CheY-like chemotaxis protein
MESPAYNKAMPSAHQFKKRLKSPALSGPTRTQRGQRPQGKVFLIVDDEDASRATITQIAEVGGNRVWTAGSAKETLALKSALRPDAVFWDLDLPDVRKESGLLNALEAHPTWRHRLIVTSAREVSSDARKFLQDHRMLLLYKPVCIEEVQEALRQVLAGEFDQNALTLT